MAFTGEVKRVQAIDTPNSGILFSSINCDVKGYRSLSSTVRRKKNYNDIIHSRDISEKLGVTC